MDSARVIKVIETTLSRRGEGVEGDPIRIITEYWTLDGEKLCEKHDPWARTSIDGRLDYLVATVREMLSKHRSLCEISGSGHYGLGGGSYLWEELDAACNALQEARRGNG